MSPVNPVNPINLILAAITPILTILFAASFFFQHFVRGPGRNLQAKFQRLGNMSGKTISQIISVAGNPTVACGSLMTWSSPTYSISLQFDPAGRCVSKVGELIL